MPVAALQPNLFSDFPSQARSQGQSGKHTLPVLLDAVAAALESHEAEVESRSGVAELFHVRVSW